MLIIKFALIAVLFIGANSQKTIKASNQFIIDNLIIFIVLILLTLLLVFFLWDKRHGYRYLDRIYHQLQTCKSRIILFYKKNKQQNETELAE